MKIKGGKGKERNREGKKEKAPGLMFDAVLENRSIGPDNRDLHLESQTHSSWEQKNILCSFIIKIFLCRKCLE